MLKSKLVMTLLAALTAAVFTAVGASSASAAFKLESILCKPGTTGKFGICWNTTEALVLSEPLELVGTEEVTAKSTTVILFVVPSIPVEIECKSVVSVAGVTLSQTEPLATTAKNTLQGKLNFKECKLVGANMVAEKCVIPSEKETLELSGEATSATNVHLTPKTGTTVIEIPFSSKAGITCPTSVIGIREITGTQDLTVSNDGLGQLTLVSIAASGLLFIAGSGLLFIAEPAQLTGSIEVKLTNTSTDWLGLSET